MANGNTHSYKVATTLGAYRVVYISAANTVAYLNTVTSVPVGMTIDAVLDTNQAIPVQGDGIARGTANDTFSAGDLVTGDSNGKLVPFTAVTAPSYCVGVAAEACAATGTVVQIKVQPDAVSIP